MNTLLEAPAPEAETVDLRHDDAGVAGNAFRISLNRGSPVLRWLETTARTIDSRRDYLERTHWKTVRRSMLDD